MVMVRVARWLNGLMSRWLGGKVARWQVASLWSVALVTPITLAHGWMVSLVAGVPVTVVLVAGGYVSQNTLVMVAWHL